MRKHKYRDEILNIKDAAKRLDHAYKIAEPLMKVGSSEIDVYKQINASFFERYGPSASLAIGAYVSGPRTIDPLRSDYFPTHRKFSKNDTVILDLQTRSGGYWADTGRTFVIGTPTTEQERIFKTLLNAKRKAENILKPGIKGKEIYNLLSKEISQAGYSQFLPHHAGHGLGLDDQESPFFIPNSEDIVEENDVVAIEPGIYDTKHGGMRIEDNYLVTNDGLEKISLFYVGL